MGSSYSRSDELIVIEQKRRQDQFDAVQAEIDSDQANFDKYQQIIDLSFFQLKDSLQNGLYSCADVLRAYRKKALEVHHQTNCLVDFLDNALDLAETLDKEYADGRPKPRLFGIPFSVKENFWVKGLPCTRGIGSELDTLMPEDCGFVAHLRDVLGAVPFCRTNVPQTLLQYVTTNPIYGTTTNPYNKERTAGGSSGGECALLAAGGSPFGIGSDVGGSLRIPAAFCGLATLKNTMKRFTCSGTHPGVPGIPRVALSFGFFTHDVPTLKYLQETFLTAEYLAKNPLSVPMPFGSHPAKTEGPLRIGYIVDDGWITPVPASRRAVDIAVDRLTEKGHILVPFEIPQPHDAVQMFVRSVLPDNGAFILGCYNENRPDPLVAPTVSLLKCPIWLRAALCYVVSRFPQIATVTAAYNSDLSAARQSNADVDKYIEEFTKLWMREELDGLITPAFPFPAPTPDLPPKVSAAVFILSLFNLIDYPAGVLKVTEVTESDDDKLCNEWPNPEGRPVSMMKNPVHKLIYDSVRNSVGLPVGVQVVTLPFREEQCIHIMGQIQSK